MLYSPSAHATGLASGFFFPGDANAPADAIEVSEADVLAVAGLQSGYSYEFSPAGRLTVFQPSDAHLLAAARNKKLGEIRQAYNSQVDSHVDFTTAAGVSKAFQADEASQSNLTKALLGCASAQATPAGFFWVSQDNTFVPFTYADMNGLAAAMFNKAAAAFATMQQRKAAAISATTLAQINAITC